MLKEIYDKKMLFMIPLLSYNQYVIAYWDHMGLTVEQVLNLDRLHLIGCGTSWHAAAIAQFFFEQICMIPTRSASCF